MWFVRCLHIDSLNVSLEDEKKELSQSYSNDIEGLKADNAYLEGKKFDLSNAIERLNGRIIEKDELSEKLTLELSTWKDNFGHIRDVECQYTTVVNDTNILRENYKKYKSIYDSLQDEINILNEINNENEFGHYEVKYAYNDSVEYKTALSECINKQKLQCKDFQAIKFYSIDDWGTENWLNPNDATDFYDLLNFKRYTYPFVKSALRAFNVECDKAIKSCSWGNVDKVKQKIYLLKKQIDSLNIFKQFRACTYYKEVVEGTDSMWDTFYEFHIRISNDYVALKLQELELFYELQLQKKKEKDEKAEFRARINEENRASKEYEKAKEIAEKRELLFKSDIEKANVKLQSAHGEKLRELQLQIESLTTSLIEATKQKERAISMAQQTRCGHVYVISNIGTMGEGVLKIGMTRRLEPLDRITELGDASVPFKFDLHAMISTDDAPALEKRLHKEFESKRVNLANYRKEFFYVTLDEVKDSLSKLCDEAVEINESVSANEYFASLAQRDLLNDQSTSNDGIIKANINFPNKL